MEVCLVYYLNEVKIVDCKTDAYIRGGILNLQVCLLGKDKKRLMESKKKKKQKVAKSRNHR
jgi:hypothetical protein